MVLMLLALSRILGTSLIGVSPFRASPRAGYCFVHSRLAVPIRGSDSVFQATCTVTYARDLRPLLLVAEMTYVHKGAQCDDASAFNVSQPQA